MIYLIAIIVGLAAGLAAGTIDRLAGWNFMTLHQYMMAAPALTIVWLLLRQEPVAREDRRHKETQLAMRILGAKLAKANGGMTEACLKVQNQKMRDEPGDHLLRTQMRNAAYVSAEGWERHSRTIYRNLRKKPEMLYEKLGILAAILGSGRQPITAAAHRMIGDIARQWKIGPQTMHQLMTRYGVEMRDDSQAS